MEAVKILECSCEGLSGVRGRGSVDPDRWLELFEDVMARVAKPARCASAGIPVGTAFATKPKPVRVMRPCALDAWTSARTC